MYRRDYIQQQLDEFGLFLTRLATHKATKNYSNFEIEIEQAVQTFIGANGKEIDALDELHLQAYFVGLESVQKKILARLFFERMLLCDEMGQTEAAQAYAAKSLMGYNLLNSETGATAFDLDVHYKLTLLKTILKR